MRDLRITVIGNGRLGNALMTALRHHDLAVTGPLHRGDAVPASDVVLLAIPERALAAVAASLTAGPIVGHCSASAPLDLLAPHERLNLHPLMSLNVAGVTPAHDVFRGAACAIDGSSSRARETARTLAVLLGMRAVHVPAESRPLYHAAASMASNFLVTLEAAAERLAQQAGITRADLAPLARASLEAWIAGGFHQAISGPISRADEAIVAGQRTAIADSAPDLLPVFDTLADATRRALQTPSS